LIYPVPVIAIFGSWLITSVYILLVFLIFISGNLINREKEMKVPYFLSWIFLLIWGLYIVEKSPVPKDAMFYYFGTIFIPFIIFFVINNIKTEKKFLTNLFDLFIFSGVVLSTISIVVFIESGFDLKLRISSMWQDNNIVSLYMLILFFMNLSFLVNREKGDKFIIYLISLFTILLGIILTQTRGVFVSMIFALAIYLIKRPKVVIPVSVIGIFLGMFFFKVFEDRFLSIRYFGSDESSLGRLQAWLSTLILLSKNFFLGYGFNSYIYLRDQIFSFYFVEVQHSHNTYLRAMLEMGFIGFVFYFSFIFIAAKFVISGISKNLQEYKKFLDGLKLTFLACIPAFMFEPYFSLYGVSTITIWIFISIAFKLKSMNEIYTIH
jgi:O-antigen ligase